MILETSQTDVIWRPIQAYILACSAAGLLCSRASRADPTPHFWVCERMYSPLVSPNYNYVDVMCLGLNLCFTDAVLLSCSLCHWEILHSVSTSAPGTLSPPVFQLQSIQNEPSLNYRTYSTFCRVCDILLIFWTLTSACFLNYSLCLTILHYSASLCMILPASDHTSGFWICNLLSRFVADLASLTAQWPIIHSSKSYMSTHR